MKKRLLTVLLLCAALMLSACGAAQKSAPETVEKIPEEMAGNDGGGTPDELGEEYDGGETEAANPIFAPLVGAWTPEHGVGILTIYQNGGFLFDAEDKLEGYLVYTDADGEDGETGPRYEMYEENNERVPNRYFALDDANPGKLAYVVGGGAELFSRPDSVYDADGIAVRVMRVEDDFLSEFAEVMDFAADDGEYSTEIVFCAGHELPDFKFLSIAWVNSNENGSFFSVEELHSLDALTPEVPLVVQTSFPGDMPNNGFSFTDANGATKYYAVLESGYDGSLTVTPFKLSETGTP